MSNRSTYNSKLLRAEPAAPAARDGVIGTVNPYWVQRAQARKQSTERRKQAYKRARKRAGGPASSQAA